MILGVPILKHFRVWSELSEYFTFAFYTHQNLSNVDVKRESFFLSDCASIKADQKIA